MAYRISVSAPVPLGQVGFLKLVGLDLRRFGVLGLGLSNFHMLFIRA